MTTYLTTTEAAQRIGMSADYVTRQCKAGSLKAKKLGTVWRISEAALEAFMGGTEPAPATRVRSARQMRRSA